MNHDQEPKFKRYRSKKEIESITVPIQMVLDKNLNGNAVRLLQIMIFYGNRPNWTLLRGHLMQEACLKREAFENAIQKLITAGYVRRSRDFIPGKYTNYEYDFCAFPEFKSENLHSESKNVYCENPVLETSIGKPAEGNLHFTSCSINNSNMNIDNKTTTATAGLSAPPSCCSFEEKQKKAQLLNDLNLNNFTIGAILKFPFEQIANARRAFDQNIKNGLEPRSQSAYLLTLVRSGAKPNITKEDLLENIEREKKKLEMEAIDKNAQAKKILIKCQNRFVDGFNFEVNGEMLIFKHKNGGFTPYSLKEKDSMEVLISFCKRNTQPGTI